jgi:A/G-specific adenine glycosylase
MPLAELGRRVKDDFGAADADWLRRLVDGLARDGLLLLEGDAARLP